MKFCLTILGIFLSLGMLPAQQSLGLFQNDSLSFRGYTLFGNNEKTYLINNCGLLVHAWESEYDPGQGIYLLENGHLLRTAKIEGAFSGGGLGGRFELFNWEGRLLWSYSYANETVQAHHDIEPLPNGNFLAIAWERHSTEEARQAGRKYEGEVWSERVVEIEILDNNQANIVWEWRLWDHLIQDFDPGLPNYGKVAEHPELVDLNYLGSGESSDKDWVHLNAIAYHPSLDQIALCSRNFGEIWIIDHGTSTAEAATHAGGFYGKGGDLLYRYGNPQAYQRGSAADQVFVRQHDARWVLEGYPHAGKFMVFNNQSSSQASSVEIWTPPINEDGFYHLEAGNAYGPSAPDWKYMAPDLYSDIMSSAQMLPNGNVLICEGKEGRFLEVTPGQDLVWEYINPVNRSSGPMAQGATVRFNEVFRATRYAPDYPAFAGKDLVIGPPIELNPWEISCDSFTIIIDYEFPPQIKILENPVGDLLILESSYRFEVIDLSLFGLSGRLVRKLRLPEGAHTFDLSGLSAGLYLLRSQEEGLDFLEKVVKK